MIKYVDVVSVDTAMYGRKVRLAPAWSRLKAGDRVKIQVDFSPFEIEGTVSDSATFEVDGEEFRLLRSFAGVKDLHFEADLKVTKKVIYEELWSNEDFEEDAVEEVVKEGGNANG